MSVRAKFKVVSITRQAHWQQNKGELHTVRLQPVTSGSEENKAFFEATPAGQIELGTLPEVVGSNFGIGQEVYVDFTPV